MEYIYSDVKVLYRACTAFSIKNLSRLSFILQMASLPAILFLGHTKRPILIAWTPSCSKDCITSCKRVPLRFLVKTAALNFSLLQYFFECFRYYYNSSGIHAAILTKLQVLLSIQTTFCL